MKSLGEIYWNIDHQCREENISMVDESTMLLHAAEEYTEELLKHEERWKSIVFHDIDYLKASAIGRSRMGQKGYSEGADLFLSYIIIEIERYGYDINDIVDPITHELVKPNDESNNNELPKDIALPEWKDISDEIKALFKYPNNFKEFIHGCFLPNGELKGLRTIVSLYDQKRAQKPYTKDKGVATRLYSFLTEWNIIKLNDKKAPFGYSKRTFQREFGRISK